MNREPEQSPPSGSDLRVRPGGAGAPALPQAQRVPAGLQTQTALSEHAGHGFLLRNPEGTSAWEIRAAEQLGQMWREGGRTRGRSHSEGSPAPGRVVPELGVDVLHVPAEGFAVQPLTQSHAVGDAADRRWEESERRREAELRRRCRTPGRHAPAVGLALGRRPR